MAKTILLIGIGGGVGSIFRYLTSLFIQKNLQTIFPLATFSINILGCFIIGLLVACIEQKGWLNSDLKFLFISGFCGGYTTFSTFAIENIKLLNSEHFSTAFLYIIASVIFGLLAVWAGLLLIKLIS